MCRGAAGATAGARTQVTGSLLKYVYPVVVRWIFSHSSAALGQGQPPLPTRSSKNSSALSPTLLQKGLPVDQRQG